MLIKLEPSSIVLEYANKWAISLNIVVLIKIAMGSTLMQRLLTSSFILTTTL